jgi:hypothetical protein
VFRPRDGVKLVLSERDPRRARNVVVGAERDHEDVRLVRAGIRGDLPGGGIDRGDRLAPEGHAGLHEIAVRHSHGFERGTTEEDVELRKAEHERVRLVDEGDLYAVAQGLREGRAELEPPEARAEDHDACHRSTGCGTMRMYGFGCFQPPG